MKSRSKVPTINIHIYHIYINTHIYSQYLHANIKGADAHESPREAHGSWLEVLL